MGFLEEQWFPILLFIISTGVSYLFWKNPVNDQLKNKRVFEDTNGTTYITGISHNGWVVNRIVSQNVEKQLPYFFQASKRNNPSISIVPQTLEDLKKLNYEAE